MNVLCSAHDPGGANAIVPVLRALAHRGSRLHGVVTGPARDIFLARNVSFFAESPSSPDIFIAGTSAGESSDKRILRELDGVPSVYVLDFWLNYWQRFTTEAKDFTHLPTRICAMDNIARDEMIAEGFPPEKIVVTGNPHFDHFADAITRDKEDPERILFVSQPLKDVANMPGFSSIGYDEYVVIRDLAHTLETLPTGYHVAIRLHPKEPREKYAEYLGSRVMRDPEETLEQALSRAGLVIGMSSPVLIQAAAANKRVISYEPGLIGTDPLVSNRLGITAYVGGAKVLSQTLALYAQGEWAPPTRLPRNAWPSGATERVVEVIDALVARV